MIPSAKGSLSPENERHIIPPMIPLKRVFIPFVCLTVGLLAACEPLAPEQTPQIIVVTGETPDATAEPLPTSPLGQAVVQVPTSATVSPMPGSSTDEVGTGDLTTTPEPEQTVVREGEVTPSATPFVCSTSSGQVIESSFYSEAEGAEVPFLMYLPPCFYETLHRYPYVILLHGTGYTETMWQDLGAFRVMDQDIANGLLPPMVLVMPDGGVLAELNDQPDGQSYETVIMDELIPTVEADFCLWGSRQGRAIGGISRGGFWAFSIALRHPDMFSILGGHSPYFEDGNALPETNPLNLAELVNLKNYPLRIYMDNAANDYVSANVIRMSEILRDNGIEHEYLINPTGDHDMDYWQAHVAEYLSFYGQSWPRDVSALPSCLEPSPP
jgi:enterochelin esterase-like enzyme